jgi:ribonuclease Z
MTPLFHPHLVNGPLGDPALYIDIKFEGRAVLFDLGEIHILPPRKILRISHVFVSHTHLDHFVGFDHLLRIFLGRDKELQIFGPPNFLKQVKHKLSAYTWNLVEGYPHSLDLVIKEVHPDRVISTRLSSSSAFTQETALEVNGFNGLIHQEPSFQVHAAFLDHKIPCLAFALVERAHINILKTELDKMGLRKGPWLRQLKEAIWREEKDEVPILALSQENGVSPERYFPLDSLRKTLVRITPGQKIAYVADTILNEKTEAAIGELVAGADYLFMETVFLEEEVQRAGEKYHLTARQAGCVAAGSGVKRLIPFHISPKYSVEPERVIQEALQTYRNMKEKKKLSGGD